MDNNESEEWSSIEGYEGLYEVSNLGRVRSLDRYGNTGYGIRLYKGKILGPGSTKNGYLQVLLCKDEKKTMFRVHRLVARTFPEICGEYRKGLEIDHRNCVRDDNRAENLHWVTRKGNCNNPLTKQHQSDAQKGYKCYLYGKFGKQHHSSKPILQFDLKGNFIAEFEGLSDAERKLSINQGNISSALNGRIKTAGGFKWKFKTA